MNERISVLIEAVRLMSRQEHKRGENEKRRMDTSDVESTNGFAMRSARSSVFFH